MIITIASLVSLISWECIIVQCYFFITLNMIVATKVTISAYEI